MENFELGGDVGANASTSGVLSPSRLQLDDKTACRNGGSSDTHVHEFFRPCHGYSHSHLRKYDKKKLDPLELWCWCHFFGIPRTAKCTNISVTKEVNPEHSSKAKENKQPLSYGTFGWSFSSSSECSGDSHHICLVKIEGSKYIQLVLSQHHASGALTLRSEHNQDPITWLLQLSLAVAACTVRLRALFVCNGTCGDVYPLPTFNRSGVQLHVQLRHAFSDLEWAPRCCSQSKIVVAATHTCRYFAHVMQATNLVNWKLMLAKVVGKRKWGQPCTIWRDGIRKATGSRGAERTPNRSH